MYITAQHRFEYFVVIIKAGIREYLHTGFAVHLFVDTLCQQGGGDAFGVLVCIGDVAEFNDDFAVLTVIRLCQSGGEGERQCGGQQ